MFLSREEEERSQQEGGSGPGLDLETGGPTFSSDEDEEDEDRDEIIHLIQPQEVHNFYACKLIDTVDVVIMGFWYYLNSFFIYVLIIVPTGTVQTLCFPFISSGHSFILL